mgnify:CR=1 FL=1
MAQVLSESELKIHAGWGANSKMAEVYIHLTAEDVNKKILKSLGLQIEEDNTEEQNILEVKICPNNICSYQNPGDAKFCIKCGYPTSLKTAVELKRIKEDEEQLHKKIMDKGINNIEIKQDIDLKEVMYQIIKNDKELMDSLRKIASKNF